MESRTSTFNETIKFGLLLVLISQFLFPAFICAEVLERVVAVVNNDVILLSELRKEMRNRRKSDAEQSESEVLDEMINRMLLLEQANKLKIKVPEAAADTQSERDAVIDEYIEKRVRAFLHIHFEELENYYNQNRELYGEKEFYDVKDEIEKKLLEPEFSKRLSEHISKLRKNSYIRVQLE